MRRSWSILAGLTLLLALFAAPYSAVLADEPANTQGFRKAVTLAGIREHQQALQTIANNNGGNRLAGTKGYDDSAAYVFNRLVAAGYAPVYQEFEFLLVADRTLPIFQRVSAPARDYVNGVDFNTAQYSGSGDVTANITAVDILIHSTPGTLSTSGCEAADFAGFPAGSIALMQRGTCGFGQKATNALAAGAVGVILFNEGNAPDRVGALNPTLGAIVNIPTVGTSFAIGNELRNGVLNGPTGVVARVRTDTIAEIRTTRNIIAETPGGDPNRVIVVGAHLDSVSRGPGINDNGSGSATILEVAETYAAQNRDPRNKLRFAWWSAEELGLIGSTHYVASLSQAERDRIEMNLNFDMLNSPNFVRFVYDGDNSAFPVGPGAAEGPAGSGEIEQIFHSYFASQGLPSAETPFSGRSDYGPFIAIGIPAGGLFTGAEGIKTAEQAAIYGGVAGQAYDPCYHLGCDNFAGTNTPYALQGLDQMSDAVAHAVLYFSKRNFAKEPLGEVAPTTGQGNGGEGGGLHDDHDHEVVAR
jgi:Zn-dependent M28 family amino/carboxypeptidase